MIVSDHAIAGTLSCLAGTCVTLDVFDASVHLYSCLLATLLTQCSYVVNCSRN